MALSVSVSTDVKKAIKELSRQHKKIPQAAARAINRTASTVRTHTSREVADQGGFKPKGIVKKNTTLKRANPRNLEARLIARGRPSNLIRFAARQTKRGVSAQPWGRRRVFPGTFIANSGRTVIPPQNDRDWK